MNGGAPHGPYWWLIIYEGKTAAKTTAYRWVYIGKKPPPGAYYDFNAADGQKKTFVDRDTFSLESLKDRLAEKDRLKKMYLSSKEVLSKKDKTDLAKANRRIKALGKIEGETIAIEAGKEKKEEVNRRIKELMDNKKGLMRDG